MLFLTTLAQSDGSLGGIIGTFFLLFWLCNFVLLFLLLAAVWRIFAKAGQPGWAAIVPIYNAFVFVRVVQRPTWWSLLLLIPFINIIPYFILSIDLARVFGKGTGFGLGLIFLPFIFLPLLAFGEATYLGAGQTAALSMIEAEPSSLNQPNRSAGGTTNLGSPLEIGAVILEVVFVIVLIGVIVGQLGARQSRASPPPSVAQSGESSTVSERPTTRPSPSPVGMPVPSTPIGRPAPGTGVESPVLRGSLTPGQKVNDTIDSVSVAHDWTFTGEEGEQITLRCDPAPDHLTDPRLTLIAPDGDVLAEDDDSSEINRGALISDLVLPQDGTYTARVTALSKGGYELELQTGVEASTLQLSPTDAAGSESPPSGDEGSSSMSSLMEAFASAFPQASADGVFRGTLAPSQIVSDTIEDPSVAHTWTFTGVAGQRITLRCDTVPKAQILEDLRIIGPGDFVSRSGSSYGEIIRDHRLLQDGTYTVQVKLKERGAYELELVASPPPPAIPIPQDADEETVFRGSLTAGQVTYDTIERLGLFNSSRISHVWTFTGKAGQRVTLRCDPAANASTDPKLTLIAPDGGVVAEDDDSGEGRGALINGVALPVDGTYFVQVKVWKEGTYVLRLE